MADYFTRFIIVERDTIPHKCAIDSGMRFESSDRDMLKYVADFTYIWLEYLAYTTANKRAIDKEINDRYRY